MAGAVAVSMVAPMSIGGGMVDPNVTLGRIGELLELLDDRDPIGSDDSADVCELDAWLARGGFLPRRWNGARP